MANTIRQQSLTEQLIRVFLFVIYLIFLVYGLRKWYDFRNNFIKDKFCHQHLYLKEVLSQF